MVILEASTFYGYQDTWDFATISYLRWTDFSNNVLPENKKRYAKMKLIGRAI